MGVNFAKEKALREGDIDDAEDARCEVGGSIDVLGLELGGRLFFGFLGSTWVGKNALVYESWSWICM